jgi:hypothetical protein
MLPQIDALTPEQAQRALLLFFDTTCEEKPPVAEIKGWADELEQEAPADVRPLLKELQERGNDAIKGEAARYLLKVFGEQEPFAPTVEEAVRRALEPRMVPIPLVIGAYIVVMAAWSADIDLEIPGKLRLKYKSKAPKLIAGIAKLAKAIPRKVLGQ